MLSLVYPLELMGNAQRAATLIERAKPLADAIGPTAQAELDETTISSEARRGLSVTDVAALEGIYRRYGDQHRRWDQARVGLELSALYIAAKDYERARDILRPTLSTFEELGDEYGSRLAELNLASAFSAIAGSQEEAESLVRRVEERARDELDNRRQRAWLCNILTRRLRMAGRYEDAEALAKEAVDIGDSLGDESLRAINMINLGNIYRDQERAEKAIEAYDTGAKAAQKCGRRDVEGDASRLIAGILNDFARIEGFPDRRSLAKVYSLHAIGLLRGTLNFDALAHSLVELGEAHNALGEGTQAAEALFEAAKNFARIPDEDNEGLALLRASRFALPAHIDIYLKQLSDVLGVACPDSTVALSDQFIALVTPIIERSPRGALIRLLSRHLYQVSLHLPKMLRAPLASSVAQVVYELAKEGVGSSDGLRILYAGIVASYLMKDASKPYLNHRLARSMALGVKDVFVRDDGVNSRIWTVVLNLGRRVTVSVVPADDTSETNLASFALAVFIKAFEEDLLRELIGGEVEVDELVIHVGNVEYMPADVRGLADQELGLTEILATQSCTVSRSSSFAEVVPTYVWLSPEFLEGVALGEGNSGSLQELFGLTLTELTFQLLRGQVEIEAIRPKVISLVGKTLS